MCKHIASRKPAPIFFIAAATKECPWKSSDAVHVSYQHKVRLFVPIWKPTQPVKMTLQLSFMLVSGTHRFHPFFCLLYGWQSPFSHVRIDWNNL